MLLLAISTYFAFMLIVAGFAKLDNISYFLASLRVAQLFPTNVINFAGKIVPLFEIIFTTILVSGVIPVAVAAVNLILFISFLGFKLFMLHREYPIDCGCFGASYKSKFDSASIAVSAILVALAVLYLWLVTWTEPAPLALRMLALTVFFAFIGLLLLRIIQRRKPKWRLIKPSISHFVDP